MTAQIYKTDCLPEKEQKKELFIRHLGEILKEKRTEAESLQGKTKSVFPFLFFPNHGVEFIVDFGDGFCLRR